MKFYSVKETSEILKLDEITLYEKIKSGDLKAFRTGKKYLISEEQIKEFLNNRFECQIFNKIIKSCNTRHKRRCSNKYRKI